ncbi:MAG: ATP-binding domain-containing protein, partial [Chlamydiae bacterium]|nr:ATP-binding domain-containing protein [Chlamydiota bacterium]
LLKILEEKNHRTILNEQPSGVSILTIHKSKGLEFSIVFALSLASRHMNREEEEIWQEKDSEKLRQLYVALTRAKEKLYIPLVFDENQKEVEEGSASPIELFASRWIYPELKEADLYKKLPHDFSVLSPFLEKLKTQGNFTYEWIREKNDISFSLETQKSLPELLVPTAVTLQIQPRFLTSFSSLAKKNEEKIVHKEVEKDPQLLPLGAETGLILHQLLEEIFLQELHMKEGRVQRKKFIEQELQETELKDWKEEIVNLISDILDLPLSPYPFCLSDLKKEEYLPEMEFLYPEANNMIYGFADLVFCKGGKYFLLDWKSNYLGPDLNSYKMEKIEEEMKRHDYFLQAKLYTEALVRYVKLFDDRKVEEFFGGAYYVFLRGKAFYHFNSSRN